MEGNPAQMQQGRSLIRELKGRGITKVDIGWEQTQSGKHEQIFYAYCLPTLQYLLLIHTPNHLDLHHGTNHIRRGNGRLIADATSIGIISLSILEGGLNYKLGRITGCEDALRGSGAMRGVNSEWMD